MILDLNAKRAARAAERGEPLRMVLGIETFDLVDELPLEIGELAESNRIGEAFTLMLAHPDADMDRLKACRPSFNDVLDVVNFFGAQLGESLKSAESSTITGPRSRPTSAAITEEASDEIASDQPVPA